MEESSIIRKNKAFHFRFDEINDLSYLSYIVFIDLAFIQSEVSLF